MYTIKYYIKYNDIQSKVILSYDIDNNKNLTMFAL